MSSLIRIIRADSKLNTILNTKFVGERSHYVEVGPDKAVLPGKFEKYHEEISNFEVRDDDVYISAFPKSGSRWTQEMVWLLLNNLDFEQAREMYLHTRSPSLEVVTVYDKFTPENYFENLKKMKSPRCIKSHLPWSLIPKSIRDGVKQPKIIVVLRGPEDVCSSYYHQARIMDGYSGNFDEFCELFLGGKIPFGPYWSHVLGFWKQKHNPNIMFLKYSEMKSDLAGNVAKVAKFLGRNLSNEELTRMCDFLTFENLKQSKGFNLDDFLKTLDAYVNPFARVGTVGDHKNTMSDEVIAAFEDQRELHLKGTGLTF